MAHGFNMLLIMEVILMLIFIKFNLSEEEECFLYNKQKTNKYYHHLYQWGLCRSVCKSPIFNWLRFSGIEAALGLMGSLGG